MSSPCKLKSGYNENGYPRAKVMGQKLILTRHICAETHGLDYYDRSWEARHTCHTRNCINPEHIVPGSTLQNRHDRKDAGTWGCISELTAQLIKMDENGTQHQIARRYGVTQGAVSRIKSGRTWAHI